MIDVLLLAVRSVQRDSLGDRVRQSFRQTSIKNDPEFVS